VLERAGVRGDAPGRDRPAPQRPQETLVPMLALRLRLDVRQGTGDTLVGVVHGLVDRFTAFRNQPVFLFPDVERSFLKRDRIDVVRNELHNAIHRELWLPSKFKTTQKQRENTPKKSPGTPCARNSLFAV